MSQSNHDYYGNKYQYKWQFCLLALAVFKVQTVATNTKLWYVKRDSSETSDFTLPQ